MPFTTKCDKLTSKIGNAFYDPSMIDTREFLEHIKSNWLADDTNVHGAIIAKSRPFGRDVLLPLAARFSSSIDKAVGFLESLGYAGVFFVSLLDRLTVFLIPAEIVLPAFGILVSQAKFSFWPVMIWVTVGNFLGNLGLYFVFLKGGRPFLEKYGKYFLITKHDLEHLDKLFLKYGDKIVFWGYFIPSAGRSIIPIPAGISKMNLYKFSLYTFFV